MIANALWHRRAKASVAYKELTETRAGAGREMMWRTGRGASAVSRRQRSRQRSNKWTVERAGVRAAGGEGCGIGERPLTYKAHLTWRWCSTRLPPLRIHCLETITNGHNRKGRCRCRYSLIVILAHVIACIIYLTMLPDTVLTESCDVGTLKLKYCKTECFFFDKSLLQIEFLIRFDVSF